MRDVQRANRFLGGTQVVTRHAALWLRAAKNDLVCGRKPVTFLDVATGSGDLPKAIFEIAGRENVDVRIIGLDFNAAILQFAREEAGEQNELRLIRGNAFSLPFADESFDYVMCSLAFHHLGMDGSVRALREMERVGRRGWLVNDLRRAWSAWYLFRAVAALTRMNRMTRHDGPASVLRAYSVPEYRTMPEALGLKIGRDFQVRRSLFYRVAIVRNKTV
jgi:SAM-dependent methyltransferase